jgi:hypothetical protein
MTALSWNARHLGDRYCSPACGRGCTWAEYQAARKAAAALVRQLGRGWRAKVWENLGWHYSAESVDGSMTVSSFGSKGGPFSAFFERKVVPFNFSRGNWVAAGATPHAAVEAVIQIAEAEIATIQEALAAYRAAVAP